MVEIISGDYALQEVDWSLPGMEKFSKEQIKKLTKIIEQENIVNSTACLGWAFWPDRNQGYYDEHDLRMIADFIEIQNKPLWDGYDEYVKEQLKYEEYLKEQLEKEMKE